MLNPPGVVLDGIQCARSDFFTVALIGQFPLQVACMALFVELQALL
ncbi:hypothetical protein [Haliscomenobacter hydrossis]|nr:hypothetical protein [Haliscomenobacter hydrossis]